MYASRLAAVALVLFVLVHITMVSLGGFTTRVRTMITGGGVATEEHV